MPHWPVFALLLISFSAVQAGQKTLEIQSGASLYMATCYNCHSLKAGVHLTGPSLSELWGKRAGRVEGFDSYSKTLKAAKLEWNEAVLREWLASPAKLVPGTTMIVKDHPSERDLKNLIGFLKIAMGPKGLERVVNEKLLPEKYALGQLQDDVSQVKPDKIIAQIQHCGKSVVLKFADGSQSTHWEVNVGYKTDSSARGPKLGKPALVKTGSLGDRFFVVFQNPAEIAGFIKSCGEGSAQK